jgi:hypothetical protein
LRITPVNNKGDDDIFQELSRRQLHNREKHKRLSRDIGYMERCDEGGKAEEGVVHKKL